MTTVATSLLSAAPCADLARGGFNHDLGNIFYYLWENDDLENTGRISLCCWE